MISGVATALTAGRRLLFAGLIGVAGAAAFASEPGGPEIRTGDVDLFFRVYETAGGRPTPEALQRDYIDAGSVGVREFVPNRIISGERLAARIRERPEVYERARSCLTALPAVKARLAPAFRTLASLHPEARFPPVTILVGRNSSGGTTGPSGVLIGLEVVCATIPPGDSVEDQFVHLIAHEYAHLMQAGAPEQPTLLEASLNEGTAELVAELISGRVASRHLLRWVKGQERAVGQQFLAAAASHDLRGWLFYTGDGTKGRPGDIGYWVGYRIAKAYYERAADKRAALKALFDLADAERILTESGWQPGD